jgi:hypothetical protein
MDKFLLGASKKTPQQQTLVKVAVTGDAEMKDESLGHDKPKFTPWVEK